MGREICGSHSRITDHLNSMKKILVTGATGFIGHYVINTLLELNCKVVATSANAHKAMKAPWFSQVSYIPFKLQDYDPFINFFSFFEYPDAVIHLAWEDLPNYKAAFHLEENLPRHKAFLQNMITNGLMDLTVTGTCFEYGMQEGCLSEEMPVKPANSYAEAKDEFRRFLVEWQQKLPFSLKWVRLFYMYGKGQGPNSLFSQLDAAIERGDQTFNMSGGEQERDYLPVERMAEYIVRIALQNEVIGVINCCSGEPVKLKHMVENYLRIRDKKIFLNMGYYPYSDYEPMRFWGNDLKLKKVLHDYIPK